MADRRAPLTVDLDCTRCGGTGRVTWSELAPGAQIRYGGPRAPRVERERLCECVRPAPLSETRSEHPECAEALAREVSDGE